MKRHLLALTVFLSGISVSADEIFFKTLAEIESKNNPSAIGDKHLRNHAYGLYQMRKPAIQDVNKFYKCNYTEKDCLNPKIAKIMAAKYLVLLKNNYERNNPTKKVTPYVLSRLWNGGYNGMDKSSTKEYGLRFVKVWAKNISSKGIKK